MQTDPSTEDFVRALARQGRHRAALDWLDQCTEHALKEIADLVTLRQEILDSLEFES